MTALTDDVPTPFDFTDRASARAWTEDALARRPWRVTFWAAFVAALQAGFEQPILAAELGSGPGHLAAQVLRNCPIQHYNLIDFSPAMHDIAGETLADEAARTEFLVRDFRRDDWSAGLPPQDAILTMQAAHEVRHKSHLPALFEGVRAALAPGGVFLFCDHYAPEDGSAADRLYFTRAEQPAALAAAGFDEVSLILDEGGMALHAARRT